MDILISEALDSPAIEALSTKYRTEKEGDLWSNPARLLAKIGPARAIMIRNQTKLSGDVLDAATRLVAIGRVGVGLDNIDVAAATRRGIVVIAPLNANAASVAELTLGLILALARKISFADRSTKSGGWDRKACTGIELDRKILTICGFGRIGRMVAARARAFGMRIVVFDPFVKADSPQLGELSATLATRFEEALEIADFVSVHSPLTPETKHLFNARAFATMKPGAFFINTSRGGVMDELALLGALLSGHLSGAGLDVREIEPPRQRSEFEAMENVILTPHIGAFTNEAQTRTFEAVCDDLDRVLRGEPAINFVNIAQPSVKSPGP
jgi:D-3-phosphoglycerate dehydrogenase / 2-oxoglutarate reductase